jgi:hypothetical protein
LLSQAAPSVAAPVGALLARLALLPEPSVSALPLPASSLPPPASSLRLFSSALRVLRLASSLLRAS